MKNRKPFKIISKELAAFDAADKALDRAYQYRVRADKKCVDAYRKYNAANDERSRTAAAYNAAVEAHKVKMTESKKVRESIWD